MERECENISAANSTSNTTGDKRLYENVYHVLYGFGLPTICACGFFGNVLNLIILAGKRVQRSLRTRERSVNTGLIALAVADMLFCITAFPSTFLNKDGVYFHQGFLLYYGLYAAAVINIFIMTSTWLTVTMSTERYLAICHPLRSRKFLSMRKTKITIIIVYILGALFNVPVFWRFSIKHVCGNTTTYIINQEKLFTDQFDHIYRATWAVFGNFIPLLLLLIFNIRLMMEIHKSSMLRKEMNGNAGIRQKRHQGDDASHRITVTLVAIVVMFFILVAPSEILKHVAYLFGSDLSSNYTYLTIEIVTNVMQTMNFSANFILYCIINPSFRRTMREMICLQYNKGPWEGIEASFREKSVMQNRYSSTRFSSLNTNSPRLHHNSSVRSLK